MNRKWKISAPLIALATLFSTGALAQIPPLNVPPAAGYVAIPNFNGNEAGAAFRGAVNDRLSGVLPIAPRVISVSFANLAAERDGAVTYCIDCQKTIPCAAGGTGAWAFGQAGQWSCNAPNAVANVLYQGQAGAQLNSIVGAKLDGSDSISNFNVNAQLNVREFGATSSTVSVTCNATGGSTNVSCSGPGDFINGQNVVIFGAQTALAAPPTGLAVTATNHILDSTYSCPIGNTHWSYRVAAVDANGAISAATAPVTIGNGQATLNMTCYNQIAFNDSANAVGYLIYDCAGTACTPNNLVAVIPVAHAPDGGGAQSPSWNDQGFEFGATTQYPSMPLNSASAGAMYAKVVSGGGTPNLVLSARASVSVNGAILVHDNAPIFNSVFAAACAQNVGAGGNMGGGSVIIPAGIYYIAQTIHPTTGCKSLRVEGQGRSGTPDATNLLWIGAPGGVALSVNQTRDSIFANFGITSSGGQTIGVGLDYDNAPGGSVPSTHNIFNLHIGQAAICTRIGNLATSNDDLSEFDMVCDGDNQPVGGIYGFYINESQAKQERFKGQTNGYAYGIYDAASSGGGDFVADMFAFSGQGIQAVYVAGPAGPLVFFRPTCEQCSRFIETAQAAAAENINVINGRFGNLYVAPDKVFIYYGYRGILNSENTDYANGTSNPNWEIFCDSNTYSGAGNQPIISSGDTFPTLTPFGGACANGSNAVTANATVRVDGVGTIPLFGGPTNNGSLNLGQLALMGNGTLGLAQTNFAGLPAAPPAWVPSTHYQGGNLVQPIAANGFYYKNLSGGNSAASQPSWPTAVSGMVVDNNLVWVNAGYENGQEIYCFDCAAANPCSGSGSGAIAKRINGSWVCN
jgi:hypothetical protein